MEETVDFLIEEATKWIRKQRNNYISQAAPLSPGEKATLSSWFAPQVIISARIKIVPVIENPPFYEKAMRMELCGLPEISQMEAVTFSDVIVVSRKYKPSPESDLWSLLLFHELVRVSAFRMLGVNKLVEFYVNDWINNGFSFEQISLEVVAEQFQKRFENYPGIGFSVEEDLKAYIKELYKNL